MTAPAPPPAPLPPAAPPPDGPALLLLHEDDLHPESLDLGRARIVAVAGRRGAGGAIAARLRAVRPASWKPRWTMRWRAPARISTCRRVRLDAAALADGAAAAGARAVIMPWAPVGWTAQALAPLGPALAARGIALHVVRRDWDSLCWPHATRASSPSASTFPRFCAALVR